MILSMFLTQKIHILYLSPSHSIYPVFLMYHSASQYEMSAERKKNCGLYQSNPCISCWLDHPQTEVPSLCMREVPIKVKLGVRFFTKIQDQIKNPDHKDFSLKKETMYPKRDYFSFISIETTHNIDGIPEKGLHGSWQCCKFAALSLYSRRLALRHCFGRAKWRRVLKQDVYWKSKVLQDAPTKLCSTFVLVN